MRNLFVKGLMAAAAVVTLASCSNDEEAFVQPTGETHEVAFGVSVATGVGTKTINDETSLNQNDGTTFAQLTDVVVVPMIGEQLQAPIKLGSLSESDKTVWKPAQVSNMVDGFRVYGNIPSTNLESIQTEGWTYLAARLDADDSGNGIYDVANIETKFEDKVIDQFPLIYYKNTNTADPAGYYLAYEATNDWDNVQSWGTITTAAIGTNNRVKIDGVGYGVGVLAAGVSYRLAGGTYEDEEAVFSEASGEPATLKYSDVIVSENPAMVLTGIAIQGQPGAFDKDMVQSDPNNLLLAGAINSTLQTERLAFAEGEVVYVDGANIYSVVMPEDQEAITVSFQFRNNTQYYLQALDGEVAPGAYAYYSTSLSPKDGNQIFDAATVTLLNGNITDWGNATVVPPTTVDIQVGVEIDITWKKGSIYDIDI